MKVYKFVSICALLLTYSILLCGMTRQETLDHFFLRFFFLFCHRNTHRSLPSADIYKVMQLAKTPHMSKH